MRTITAGELATILALHGEWVASGGTKGKRANLTEASLAWANLAEASLAWADLSYANLAGANLAGANLTGANLAGANLTGANLAWANLTEANLTGANLTEASLARADLTGANLAWADLAESDLTGTGCCHFAAGRWSAWITPGRCKIGCKGRPHAFWREQTPESVASMSPYASEWWAQWRGVILAACDACAAHGWPKKEDGR
jgi:uncharacterized protein YjbI with pentapeptide repeats